MGAQSHLHVSALRLSDNDHLASFDFKGRLRETMAFTPKYTGGLVYFSIIQFHLRQGTTVKRMSSKTVPNFSLHCQQKPWLPISPKCMRVHMCVLRYAYIIYTYNTYTIIYNIYTYNVFNIYIFLNISYIYTPPGQKFFLLTSCCNPLPLDSWQVSCESHGGSQISWFAFKRTNLFRLEIRSATWATRNEDNWSAAEDHDVYKTLNGKNFLPPDVYIYTYIISLSIILYIQYIA